MRSRAYERLAHHADAYDEHHARIQETAAAQAFPANLTNADVGGAGVSRIAISTQCVVMSNSAACASTPLRQHFLKRDAVFFDVLVYSE
jgi:hypothetical protein